MVGDTMGYPEEYVLMVWMMCTYLHITCTYGLLVVVKGLYRYIEGIGCPPHGLPMALEGTLNRG